MLYYTIFVKNNNDCDELMSSLIGAIVDRLSDAATTWPTPYQ